jgi:hypothetical protein
VTTHGNDLALQITQNNVPATLVDAELRLARSTSVSVGRRDDVSGCVADSQVQDFALLDDGVERVHDLLDAGGPVPPVQVQDVDPLGVELLERVAERDVQGALMVAGRVDGAQTFALLVADVVAGELGCDDHLVSVATLLHPLADPELGFVVLVVIGTVVLLAGRSWLLLNSGCSSYVSMKLPPAATKASRSSKAAFLSMEPSMPSQALPKLMAPSCNGETRMPAVLERTLYLPSEVGGSGAGSKSDML